VIRERTTDIEAAATQIGQLIPASAEKRSAAPRAEVRAAAVQVVVAELSRMVSGSGCRVLYNTK
jgi:hypothetical protein